MPIICYQTQLCFVIIVENLPEKAEGLHKVSTLRIVVLLLIFDLFNVSPLKQK